MISLILGLWVATVEAADFKSQTASEITFIISSKVADGEITAVTKSGIRIPFGEITTVVPSQLVADIVILDKELNVRCVWSMGKIVPGTDVLLHK